MSALTLGPAAGGSLRSSPRGSVAWQNNNVGWPGHCAKLGFSLGGTLADWPALFCTLVKRRLNESQLTDRHIAAQTPAATRSSGHL